MCCIHYQYSTEYYYVIYGLLYNEAKNMPLYRHCKDNDTALFTALNLGPLLNLPSGSVGGAIRNAINITQV